MTPKLKFLLLIGLFACFANAQQTPISINGYNQVVGQWDASQAARTNNSRQGVGSPVGRDSCLRQGESYFQTDATPGNNNWYCTVTGFPGTWTNGIAAAGTVTSIATSCGISGGTITTSGTVQNSIVMDSQIGSGAYAIPSSDCGKQINRNNAAAVSDTLAQAGTGGFVTGWYVGYQCVGLGGCIITPTTSTIYGSASLALAQGQGVTIISDGTNYQVKGGVGGGQFSSGLTAALPTQCAVGQTYNATDASAGKNIYVCTAANTWTQQVGGGGTVTSIATTGPITGGTITGAGTIACATCATTTNGGALSGTGPVAISAAGAVSITGGAGQVLAGSTPAFTATPTLGGSGTLGSLTMGNATSGTITLQPVTGALGSVTVSIPAATDTLVNLAGTQTLTNKSIATTQLTGALQAGQEPAHTGDMTNSAGSLATTVVGLNGTSLSGLATGLLKNTTGTGVPSIGASADILAACTTCVTSASSLASNALVLGAGSQGTQTGNGDFTYSTHTLTGSSSAIIDMSAMSPTGGFLLPGGNSSPPTADKRMSFQTTNHNLLWGSNGTTMAGAVAATGTNTATTCTNQVVTAVSSIAVPTCTALTNAYLPAAAGGGPAGGVAAITSNVSNVNTSETNIVQYQIPANTIAAGTTYRIMVWGLATATVADTGTFNVYFGPTGNNTDTKIGTEATTSGATGTSVPFQYQAAVTFRSTTVAEHISSIMNKGITGLSTTTNDVAAPTNTTGLTTSSPEYLTMTFVSSATTLTCTFPMAYIELVKQ